MKTFLMLAVLFSSAQSYAIDCPVKSGENYQAQVQAAIESQKTCAQASDITEACAMGSSMDAIFADSAIAKCSKRINQSPSAKKAVVSGNQVCANKYAKLQGTIALSELAFCKLAVAKFYNDLLAPARH